MEKIDRLVRYKKKLIKEAIDLMHRLEKDFFSEEKFDWRVLLNVEKIAELEKKYGSMPKNMKTIKKVDKEGMKFLARDINELREERELTQKLFELINEINRLSEVEYKYVKHYLEQA